MVDVDEMPQWDVPGWDWEPGDYTWLDAGARGDDGASIFFIHGGRIRHQAHIPEGDYSIEQFARLVAKYAKGLDEPVIRWMFDTGGGDAGLWVEGTRAPVAADLERLRAARAEKLRSDRNAYMGLRQRHPEWFIDGVELDEYGRPA